MSRISRRGFIGATVAAGALGAAGATGAVLPGGRAEADPAETSRSVFGTHQPGIVEEQAAAVAYLSADVTATTQAQLTDLLKTLTWRAGQLSAGGSVTPTAADEAPDDNGILGPRVPGHQLTVTVGFGSSLFDDRFGLARSAPSGLGPMRVFPGDRFDPARTGGDLGIHIRAASADETVHAVRDIVKHTDGAVKVRWRMSGTVGPSRPAGAPRNYLGFKDGIANPDVADRSVANSLLWVQPGQGPAWTAGGTFQVVRIIRITVEQWDRSPLQDQQYAIGRFRDSGAPLDGHSQHDIPDYARDPAGQVIPITAHIRLANPRTPETASSLILRRGFNYDLGLTPEGGLDQGLVFVCYQQDIARQFEAVQTRLFDEPLARYTTVVGGGYFFVPPGLTGPEDFYGRGMFA